LPRYVEDGKFNHQRLFEITYVATKNLNKIIDSNYYPVVEARNSQICVIANWIGCARIS
jgi:ribonucleoside-diphosphate reductase alpha chain